MQDRQFTGANKFRVTLRGRDHSDGTNQSSGPGGVSTIDLPTSFRNISGVVSGFLQRLFSSFLSYGLVIFGCSSRAGQLSLPKTSNYKTVDCDEHLDGLQGDCVLAQVHGSPVSCVY